MPTHQHAQRPADNEPPPCDCGGCRERQAIYADARRELPLAERLAKRDRDRVEQRRREERDAERALADTPLRTVVA